MTSVTTPPFLVVTDLDGTLLDHHNYSWTAAKDSLTKLKTLEVPVIINTSKTYEEVVALQKVIGIKAPFIVENGSAVALPKVQFPNRELDYIDKDEYWIKILGQKRDFIGCYVGQLRNKNAWNFEGYLDWNLDKIIELTGLDPESAILSFNRSYSEPLIWNDSETNLTRFRQALNEQDLRLLKGGRFYHVIGNTNKGIATNWLKSLYSENIPVVCLGDSPNDIDMLDVADYPVLVKAPNQDYPKLTKHNPNAIKTSGLGPIGWAKAINTLIEKL